MAASLSMQPKDAAEIHDLFFRANASERAAILHYLDDTPLKASPRIPAARAARAIETLEMAAFAADVENFTHRTRRKPDPARAHRRAGGRRSRRRTAGLRGKRARHAEPGVSTRAAVPEARDRHLRSYGLPPGAALRPPQRAIGAHHAGGLARLGHGERSRQTPPRALRRRTPARTRGIRAGASRAPARIGSDHSHRHGRLAALTLWRRRTFLPANRIPTSPEDGFLLRRPRNDGSNRQSLEHYVARSRKCRPALSSVSTIQASGSKRTSLASRSSTAARHRLRRCRREKAIDRPAVIIDRLRCRHVEHRSAIHQRHLDEDGACLLGPAPAYGAEYAFGLAAAQIGRHPDTRLQSHGIDDRPAWNSKLANCVGIHAWIEAWHRCRPTETELIDRMADHGREFAHQTV